MLAAILAQLAAAAAAPAAAPSPNVVAPVTVQAAPSTTIAPRPDATVRSTSGADDAHGDYVGIWPASAYAAGKNGRVTLSCLIDVHGLAESCRVAAESPLGQGFGKAALEMKPTFKLTPAHGPKGPIASTMTINVDFTAPDFQFDQKELARQAWTIRHSAMASISPMDLPYSGNRLEMQAVTMVDSPIWITAATFDDLAQAYPAKGRGVEGYAAAHCKVERTGPDAGVLSACQVIKEAPHDRDFAKAALSLAVKFRLAPEALARAPHGENLWVDIPIRMPPPAQMADRTIRAPVWLADLETGTAPSYFPGRAIESGVTAGRGAARCTVTTTGTLTDCAPEKADPDGLGFSEAVMRMAGTMRMNLWSADGAPVEGGVVRLAIRLEIKKAGQ